MWLRASLRISGIIRVYSASFHNSSVQLEVNKSLLSKLRKKTGYPFIKCKDALQKFGSDIEKAEKWMKEEAQKEGWAKATKLQDRPMSQGLVGLLLENNCAVIVEVNCETDFVARNTKFQNLLARVVSACHQHVQSSTKPKVILNKESMNTLPLDDGKAVADIVALEVGNIGENIAARRAIGYRIPSNCHLGHYVHCAGPEIPKIGKCHMGKYGSFVLFEPPRSSDYQLLNELGRQLAQHVVGMNPQRVGNSEEEPCEDSGDETRMIFQEFLLDPSMTVGEILKQNSVTVMDFARFECGEEIKEKFESSASDEPVKATGF